MCDRFEVGLIALGRAFRLISMDHATLIVPRTRSMPVRGLSQRPWIDHQVAEAHEIQFSALRRDRTGLA
jgi:hypothetical protein